MGLLYIMPKSEKEANQISTKNNTCIINSYSLPYIFWIYFLIGLIVITAMSMPALPILKKLFIATAAIDRLMGYLTAGVLFAIPFSGLCFLFYKKSILLDPKEKTTTLTNSLFGLKIRSRKYDFLTFEVRHFLTSPNMAKIKKETNTRSFENRGHYILVGYLKNNKEVMIDRHTNKADLVGLKSLIEEKLNI